MSALIRPAVPADGARCAQIHMDALGVRVLGLRAG